MSVSILLYFSCYLPLSSHWPLTLTCWWDEVVFSRPAIVVVTGADRLLLLLVGYDPLSRTLKHGFDDNRILVDLQLRTDAHTHTHTLRGLTFIHLTLQTAETRGLRSQIRENLHLRALQVIRLGVVAQEVNIFFQIPHTSVLVIAYALLWSRGSAEWTRRGPLHSEHWSTSSDTDHNPKGPRGQRSKDGFLLQSWWRCQHLR